jgi:hypothetical protein
VEYYAERNHVAVSGAGNVVSAFPSKGVLTRSNITMQEKKIAKV